MADPLPLKHLSRGPSKVSAVIRPPAPDPLADVDYTGDLEADAASELTALQGAFRDRKKQERARFQQATDSEFWLALCFESREQKEAFLAAFALTKVGDKYLDGRQVAAILGVALTEE